MPVVGHAHPRVTEAIARQARTLNTNMRYLHPTVIELAERLVATTPDELDTVMFVNTGSEANDLAWRLATVASGNRGGVCTDFAYHGVTEAIAALSPENWPNGRKPDHIETFAPPRPLPRDASGRGLRSRPRSSACDPAVTASRRPTSTASSPATA